MSRRKTKRDGPKSSAKPVSKRATTPLWWWPVACFSLGLAAALVARQFLFQADQSDTQIVGPAGAEVPVRPRQQSNAAAVPLSPRSEPIPAVPDASDLDLNQFSPAEREFAEHFRKGYASLKDQRYADAMEELKMAAGIDPTVPDAYHFIGEIYQKLLLLDQAEQAYRQALAVRPDYTLSRKKLAVVLYETGRYEQAVEVLAALRHDRPDDTVVLGELAINAIALGKPAEAIPLLEAYNQAEGKQAWGYAHLGRAHDDAGHVEQAEKAYRAALAVSPNFSLAQYWLGQLLASSGRTEESERLLNEYARIRKLENEAHQLNMALLGNPNDVRVLVNLARVRYLLGDPEQSLALLQRALRLSPNDPKLVSLYRQVSAAVDKKKSAR